MKTRVIKEFIDRYTGDFYAVGKEILLTAERFAEIEKAGPYVEKIEWDESVEQSLTASQPPADIQELKLPEQSEDDGQPEPEEQPEPEQKPKKTRRGRK